MYFVVKPYKVKTLTLIVDNKNRFASFEQVMGFIRRQRGTVSLLLIPNNKTYKAITKH